MRYEREVDRAVAHWGPVYGVEIDPALIHAIIQKESSHGAALVSSESRGRKSYGPMMVLDSTARELGASNPAALSNPALGIWYGVKYFARLLRQHRGNVVRAVHAYNGWGSDPVSDRPNAYVSAVLGFWRAYRTHAGVSVPATVILVIGAIYLATRRRRAA